MSSSTYTAIAVIVCIPIITYGYIHLFIQLPSESQSAETYADDPTPPTSTPSSTLSRQLQPRQIEDLLTCLNESTTTPESVEYEKTDEWLRRRYNYKIESYSVITQDRYILKIFRVLSPSTRSSGSQRPVVFLNHGLGGSSNQWLVQEGQNNIVQLLVDEGYEVWLGNCRGNSYSNNHLFLKENDLAFWDFSWHEMGIYDVPAVIDKILAITDLPNINYLGYSMGATQYIVMLSERPEYNSKIKKGFLLAPAIIIKNSTSPVRAASIIGLNINGLYLTDPILGGRIKTNSAMEKFFGVNYGEVCASSKYIDCEVCSSTMFFLYGFNTQEMNYTALPSLYTNYPDVIGTKCLVHYSQIMNDPRGRFKRFDYGLLKNYRKYGSFSPPEYNIRNVKAPTYIYYGRGDNLTPKINVEEFARKLQKGTLMELNLMDKYNKKSKFNHLDFVSGKHDYEFYGSKIIAALKDQ